jgi:hypothetical protein
MTIQVGDVLLLACVYDPDELNPKMRPVVVIQTDNGLWGVAVSTQFRVPLHSHEVLLYDG